MAYWAHSNPYSREEFESDEGMRECARADRCADPRLVDEGGKWRRLPALTPRPFCDADRDVIARCIDTMPTLFVRVHMELGNMAVGAAGVKVAISKSAPVPLSLAVDELLRMVVSTLVSWEERVRTVARLVELDSATSRLRRHGPALSQACTTLAGHLDVMLALPPEPMIRDGDVWELSGADAGLDVLDLHWRCRALLTETRKGARRLTGVPCGGCGFTELVEVLDDDGQFDGARCRRCAAEYDAVAYTELTREQEQTVKAAGAYIRSGVRPGALDDLVTRRA